MRNSMVLIRKAGDIPNTSGDVDLFSESELRNEGLSLGVGIGPSRSGRVHPWGRINGRRVGEAVVRSRAVGL